VRSAVLLSHARILSYLQAVATQIISGEKPNAPLYSDSTSESSVSNGESEEEDAGRGAIEVEDIQERTTHHEENSTTSELKEIFAAIIASNRSLMKLSMVIRNSPDETTTSKQLHDTKTGTHTQILDT